MTTKLDVQTKLELLKVAAQLTTANQIHTQLNEKGIHELFEREVAYLLANYERITNANTESAS